MKRKSSSQRKTEAIATESSNKTFDINEYSLLWKLVFSQIESNDICHIIVLFLSCTKELLPYMLLLLNEEIKNQSLRFPVDELFGKFMHKILENSQMLTKRSAYLIFSCSHLSNNNISYSCISVNELTLEERTELKLCDVNYHKKETGDIIPARRLPLISPNMSGLWNDTLYNSYSVLSDENLSFRSCCFVYNIKNLAGKSKGTGFARIEMKYARRLYIFLQEIDNFS